MSRALFEALQQLLGANHVQSCEDAAAYLTDKQGRYVGQVIAAVHPASTEEVAAVVRACVERNTPIVVQGGNTSLMGGATPDASGHTVLLLLDRLNRVRSVDTDNDTLTVESGCILQNVQNVARHAGRLFPLSPGRRRQLHDWRQSGHQCRRHCRVALRQYPRTDPGPGSGDR
jgi:FAD/FMN-containing dehydrogenase